MARASGNVRRDVAHLAGHAARLPESSEREEHTDETECDRFGQAVPCWPAAGHWLEVRPAASLSCKRHDDDGHECEQFEGRDDHRVLARSA